ncbi:carbohydrate ABC transporter permease [Halorussus salinisoli]|uniref:carbohydrate ABC transporter permease n=1 Tax=Halorussus salinisoli TaxID=2558242 RepID=UPI0010C1F72B|nr:sugar ABC transporter permease [Halorussus salinisoli]
MSVRGYIRSFVAPDDGREAVDRRQWLLGYGLVLPAIVLIGAVIIYPLFYNVYLSFTEVPLNPDLSPEWVGFSNYEQLLTSRQFWRATVNTVVFTVGSSVLSTVAGLGTALLFNHAFRGRRLARGLVLLPHVTPIIAVAFAWQFMLSPLWGSVPYILESLGVYQGNVGLLETREFALPMAVLFDTWRNFPFAFLLIIARLQAIPASMYEAARLDGAGPLARFKDITLPELRGVIAIAMLLRFVWEFNAFEPVWLLTRNLLTLPIFAYQSAFANFEMGLGAAIALLLFAFQMILVGLYIHFIGEEKL